jgi:DNA-binding MarR family transcriptional regulator
MQEEWKSVGDVGACACSAIRRTARKVSLFYDQALQPCGLTVTQYAVLVNVGRSGPVGRTALAGMLGMDRTTLTRNLKPLEEAGLIVPAESGDHRQRLLRASAEGIRKVRKGYALWKKAQESFVGEMGADVVEHLRGTLKAAEAAAERVIIREPTKATPR